MPASLTDKLLLTPAIGLVVGKTIAAALTGLITGTGGAPTYGTYVSSAGVRALLSTINVNQIQWILPTFVSSYKTWCKSKKITPNLVTFSAPSGDVQGFWLGDKSKAKYHMLYIHGGGWVIPGSSGQLDMLTRFIKWSNNKLAVFCVAYTLSPKVRHPVALGQCVEGLRYILAQPGASPSKTLIGGDSAGGNLMIGILSHLLHPHPKSDIVKPLELKSPLFGAIVVSPWISADSQKYKSFVRNEARDSFPISTAQYWSGQYKGPNVPDDEYIWPTIADATWWKGSPCKTVLTTVGENEVLFDSIVDWTEKYREGVGSSDFALAVGKGEMHIAPVMSPKPEKVLEDPADQGQERAIMLWIKAKLV